MILRNSFFLTLVLLIVAAASAAAFTTTSSHSLSSTGGTAFVASQRRQQQQPVQQQQSRRHSKTSLYMGKNAKFGVFSPAVYVAVVALGRPQLNKLRGKAISLHSQVIGDFCEFAGAYYLRTKLIKLAKTNGDILGFLV